MCACCVMCVRVWTGERGGEGVYPAAMGSGRGPYRPLSMCLCAYVYLCVCDVCDDVSVYCVYCVRVVSVSCVCDTCASVLSVCVFLCDVITSCVRTYST